MQKCDNASGNPENYVGMGNIKEIEALARRELLVEIGCNLKGVSLGFLSSVCEDYAALKLFFAYLGRAGRKQRN